jgi:hypothetical protein
MPAAASMTAGQPFFLHAEFDRGNRVGASICANLSFILLDQGREDLDLVIEFAGIFGEQASEASFCRRQIGSVADRLDGRVALFHGCGRQRPVCLDALHRQTRRAANAHGAKRCTTW